MRQSHSTQSLHSNYSSILRQQPQNTVLPHSRSNIRLFKTSQGSSFYNARGRLNTLREVLSNLQQQLLQGGTSNKDIELKLIFFKQEYLEKKLGFLEADLQGKIKELKKKILIGRRSDILKYESMHNILDGMAKNHRQLERMVFEIEEKVSKIEQAMGFQTIRVNKPFHLPEIRYSFDR